MDHGYESQIACDYASVAYWYQTEPHAAFPTLPTPSQRALTSAWANLVQAVILILALGLGLIALVWGVVELAGRALELLFRFR
jgi:hypothetical protein